MSVNDRRRLVEVVAVEAAPALDDQEITPELKERIALEVCTDDCAEPHKVS
jgi:hypothetical protein